MNAWSHRCLGLALAMLALAHVGGVQARQAAPPVVQLWQIAREVPGAEPRWQRDDTGKSGVRVWRGGREIEARRQMELLPGDEMETSANVTAVVRVRDVGDLFLIERTRVKMGSLEVFFGRVFAQLRNRFTVSSQTVVAGVEGTQFLFEVSRDRAVRVAVADGAVVCRSPRGAWAPVNLRAHQTLLARYPGRASPQVGAANVSELRTYEQLSREVSRAQPPGTTKR